MDRNRIYLKGLHEHDLTGLAELCTNVALHRSASHRQSDTAHALHVEWVQMKLSQDRDKTEGHRFLRERMIEFLTGVPIWMFCGS